MGSHVKMSVVTEGTRTEQGEDVYVGTDSPRAPKDEEGLFGPRGSKFSVDNTFARWKAMSTPIPGAEGEDDLTALVSQQAAEWANKMDMNDDIPKPAFHIEPKVPFDVIRMLYGAPDPTACVDLKENVPKIVPFWKIYRETDGDLEYIEGYYLNRRGLIRDLINHTKDEIKTQKDPWIKRTREEFLKFLEDKLAFVEDALSTTYKWMDRKS